MKHMLIGLGLLACVSTLAHAEPLKVKPGLWETTTTTEKKGSKHPTNLDQLTPEQRAKVEADLAKRAKKETTTTTTCLTAARIKNGEAFVGKTHGNACTRTFEKQTASDVVANIECRGANKMTGKVRMHANDPENMNGVVDMTYGDPDRVQLLTHSEIKSRWLKAECGKVDKKAHGYGH